MSYFLYILRNPNNKLYIGQSRNLNSRINRHSELRGAKFTKNHKNFELVYREEYKTLGEATKREKQLKGWTRAKKEALISGNKDLLKKL